MDLRERVVSFVRGLPVAHRVVIVAAVAGTALAGFAFFTWITSPAYTLLYADLDDVRLQQVIEGLEAEGVPYKIEGGGSRVLVPSDQLYETRASLAAEGIEGGAVEPPGYELLDEQGVGTSNFKQRVDYQRALEGELSATLTAMDAVETANVRLVIPEEELFEEEQKPVTASVLLDTARELEPTEVETVAFMVSSSVEGLEASNVTVADTDGTVLQAPGDAGGSAVTSRIMRQTREFEQLLAEDVRQLVATAGGGEASVVVRATMNFDEAESTQETYDPDSQVSLREDTEAETFAGEGAAPGGTVGVDGGPTAGDGNNSDYERDRSTVEYGVDRETTVTRRTPGTVERMSVAIVMDDGALTGTTPPAVGEVEQLVTAALGIDEARGDSIAVSAVPFPAAEEAPAEAATADMVDLAARIAAVVVLLLIAVIFILMLRRRRKDVKVIDITRDAPAAPAPVELVDAPQALAEPSETAQQPQAAGSVAALKADVAQLVEEQPEDIAVLLRGWLADRRT